jgi:hypothetical protein
VVEVFRHQIDSLRLVVVVDIFGLAGGPVVALSRFELDDACISLLSRVSEGLDAVSGQLHYLECVLLNSGLEVVGLTGQDDFVQVEVVWAADQLAV